MIFISSVDAIAEHGVSFMPGPPDSYYDMLIERVSGYEEPIERMKKHGILIDGEGVVNGGKTKILLTNILKNCDRSYFP